MPTASGKTIREIVDLCAAAGLQTKIVPGLYELLGGAVSVSQLRPVQIEDLLRRAPVQTDIAAVAELLAGKRVLVTGGVELIDHARKLSTQARDPAPHYQHTEIGYNYRMSNVLAAIGRGQLQALAERVQRKREIFDFYVQALGNLPGISFMPEASWGRSNRWLTVITVDSAQFGADREAIRLALEFEHIEARPVWKPMHLQPVSHACESVGGRVAEALFRDGLCLPAGVNLRLDDLSRVVEGVRRLAR